MYNSPQPSPSFISSPYSLSLSSKMLGHLNSYFTGISFDSIAKPRKQTNRNCIYRDELDKKTPSLRKLKKRAKGSEAKPLLRRKEEGDGKKLEKQSHGHGVDHQKKEGLKVKVLMTKEEAARLMSKCKDGGVLEFKDVARELLQIPTNRVAVVSSSTSSDLALESIPEEF